MGQTTALWMLGVGNAFAVWSAFNPSYFTLRKFVDRDGSDEDKRDALVGMVLASVVILGMFIAIASIARNSK